MTGSGALGAAGGGEGPERGSSSGTEGAGTATLGGGYGSSDNEDAKATKKQAAKAMSSLQDQA